MPDSVPFTILTPGEAEKRIPERRARRNWGPVVDALIAGRTLFVAGATDSDTKYLSLAIARRGRTEMLHSQKTIRQGETGRMLWVIERPEQKTEVPTEVVG